MTIKIHTGSDLMKFRDMVAERTAEYNVFLMNDIDIASTDEKGSPVSWKPIGNNHTYPFRGTFDGKGHTISGLYICEKNKESIRNALFGVNEGTIQNLTVDGVVEGYCGVAGVCAQNQGNILNVKNKCRIKGHAYTAGIVATNNRGTIRNCINSGEIICGEISAGVVGFCYGTDRTSLTQVTGCKNNGTILYTAEKPYSYHAMRDNDYKFNQICCGMVDKSNKQNGKVCFSFQNTLAGLFFRYGDIGFNFEIYQNIFRHDPDHEHVNENGDTYLHLVCQNYYIRKSPKDLLRMVEMLAAETNIDFAAVNKDGKEAALFLRDPSTGRALKGCAPVIKLINSVKKEQEAEIEMSYSDIGF